MTKVEIAEQHVRDCASRSKVKNQIFFPDPKIIQDAIAEERRARLLEILRR